MPGWVFTVVCLLVTTCTSHGAAVLGSSTHTPRFSDRLLAPSPSTARRIGSWLQEADHIVGVEPSGSGHAIGVLPQVFLSPMFHTFITGTVSRPLLTRRCGWLATFLTAGSIRRRMRSACSCVPRAQGPP